MFYFMMALLFRHRSGERLSLLVTVLMTVIGMQSIKDLFFIDESLYATPATCGQLPPSTWSPFRCTHSSSSSCAAPDILRGAR